MASVEVNQMLAAAVAACEDKKAEDIRVLALDPSESGLTDYFLICNGANNRQTVAITDEIELRLKREYATYPNSVEGRRQGEWILMDYVDFIVHVFLPEKRAFYGLERLRKSATTLNVDELNSAVKSAIEAKRPAPKKAGKKTSAKRSSAGNTPAKRSSAGKKTSAKRSTPAKTVAKKSPPKRAVKQSSPGQAAPSDPAKEPAPKKTTRSPRSGTKGSSPGTTAGI